MWTVAKGAWKAWVVVGVIIAAAALMFTRPTALTAAQTGISQVAWGMGAGLGLLPTAAKNLSEGVNDSQSLAQPDGGSTTKATPKAGN